MRTMLLLFVLANAGCLHKTEFQCTNDQSCGAAGRCEATGFCSFVDGDCTSGRRYDSSAGTLGGQCTSGGNAMTDGGADAPKPPGDGAGPDTPTAGCPSGYVTLSGGEAGHYYKVLATAQNWDVQEAACRATTTAAHLAAPADLAELTALDTAANGNDYWLGITDSATEGTWLTAAGTPQTYLPWVNGAPDGGVMENCVQGLPPTHKIDDLRCNMKLAAICECAP